MFAVAACQSLDGIGWVTRGKRTDGPSDAVTPFEMCSRGITHMILLVNAATVHASPHKPSISGKRRDYSNQNACCARMMMPSEESPFRFLT